MKINFLVNNQTIKRTDENTVVADSHNYLIAEFTFSDEWQGIITAVFKNSSSVYNQILDENNRCIVPWEAITPGILKVSCFCNDRITAAYANVKVEQSGYELGESTKEPSEDVYTQLLKAIKINNAAAVAGSYSLEEKRIGKWADNKPLYQRTVGIELPTTDGPVTEIDGSDFDEVISIEGFIRNVDSDVPTDYENFFFSGGFYISATDHVKFTYYRQAHPTQSSPNGIYCELGSDYRGALCALTIKYTKKSDKEESDDE